MADHVSLFAGFACVVPAPGAQIVYWTLTDADDDNVAATFSIWRRRCSQEKAATR